MAALRFALRSCTALRLGSSAAARRGYKTLVVADREGAALHKATLSAVSAASKLPGSEGVDLLVLGKGAEAAAEEGAGVAGVSRVLTAASGQMEHPVADTTAELLVALQKANGYKVLAGLATSLSRETLPRVAAKLDVQPVTDVIGVGAETGVFTRPMYAGNAIATVKTSDDLHVLTFRPTAFEPAVAASTPASVEALPSEAYESAGIEWVSDSEKVSDKPQLSSADVVVSGGRALKSGENFEKVLEPLCDKLNAAMGASRAAVDAGFVPNELQVGQTGKVVAPKLYFAVGISGAIQHLAGMKDSKTIVAINKDADAPIFQIADYGLVADLFEAVPELQSKV